MGARSVVSRREQHVGEARQVVQGIAVLMTERRRVTEAGTEMLGSN